MIKHRASVLLNESECREIRVGFGVDFIDALLIFKKTNTINKLYHLVFGLPMSKTEGDWVTAENCGCKYLFTHKRYAEIFLYEEPYGVWCRHHLAVIFF